MNMNFNSPFFILGNPRSGTSLFRLMLNNHPEIVVPPECGFAEWLYEEFGGEEMSESTYRQFLLKVFKTRKFETWELNFDEILYSIKTSKPSNYQELVREIYRGYARKFGKDSAYFGDKNNYYINNVEKLEKIFPNCKKIFIVRDGRDVACSYLELEHKNIDSIYSPNLTKDVTKIAREWCKSVAIMTSWTSGGAISIRYEDLVLDPNATLQKVCEFLNVAYSENMLDYYKNNDEPEEFKAWKGKTFEPIEGSSVGRYKRELSLEQLADFERISKEMLEKAGYGV
ncbi:Sulfotransferase family protein [Marinobacter salarius]|uniref:sulfotransferase family protein n=1 Tax=Marinobacter salarius TaxID=1420917 RepID=UPI0012581F9B|nr:sulfotransferase [Marinobacter salarius]VVT06242.1 Sulfotransferase family protein [Marinobacter salarius]VXC07479.1 Sulfotransferase family protein [Marinobacter salarius]